MKKQWWKMIPRIVLSTVFLLLMISTVTVVTGCAQDEQNQGIGTSPSGPDLEQVTVCFAEDGTCDTVAAKDVDVLYPADIDETNMSDFRFPVDTNMPIRWAERLGDPVPYLPPRCTLWETYACGTTPSGGILVCKRCLCYTFPEGTTICEGDGPY